MTPDLSAAEWRKARGSGGENGNCVEVSRNRRASLVRDSKNPTGPVLTFDKDAFDAFLSALKNGRIN